MENHHEHPDHHDELRRSQNGTQWGTERNANEDADERLHDAEDEGFLANDSDPDDAEDWGAVDPQSGSYDPDTDPSGPGSAV